MASVSSRTCTDRFQHSGDIPRAADLTCPRNCSSPWSCALSLLPLEVSDTLSSPCSVLQKDADCTSLSLGSAALSTGWGFQELAAAAGLFLPPLTAQQEEGQPSRPGSVGFPGEQEVQGCLFPQGKVCPNPWGWDGMGWDHQNCQAAQPSSAQLNSSLPARLNSSLSAQLSPAHPSQPISFS